MTAAVCMCSNLIGRRTLQQSNVGSQIVAHWPVAQVLQDEQEAGVCPGPVAGRCWNTLSWLLLQPKLSRPKQLLVPGIDLAKTIRNSRQRQRIGAAICSRRRRDAQCPGLARCGRARVRTGKRYRRALPPRGREGAGSAQPVAGDQQSYCQ